MFRSQLSVNKIVVLLPLIWFSFALPTANAQRLRDRIRSRIQSFQAPQPVGQQPVQRQQSTVPRYRVPSSQTNPAASNQANRAQAYSRNGIPMQRVSPINPQSQRQGIPGQVIPGQGNPTRATTAQNLNPLDPRLGNKSTASREGFGNSILSTKTPAPASVTTASPNSTAAKNPVAQASADMELIPPSKAVPINPNSRNAKTVPTTPLKQSPSAPSVNPLPAKPLSAEPLSTQPALAEPIDAQPLKVQRSKRPASALNELTPGKFEAGIKKDLDNPFAMSPNKKPAPNNTLGASTNKKASLGIEVVPNKGAVAGLRVAKIKTGSRAAVAGLHVGDVIVAVDGKPTPTTSEIGAIIAGHQPGDFLPTKIVRGETATVLKLPLIARSAIKDPTANNSNANPTNKLAFGATVAEMNGSRGLIVSDISKGSPAEAAGVKTGDRIISLGGRMMTSVDAYHSETDNLSEGDETELQMVRQGKLITANVVFTQPKAKRSIPNKHGSSALGGFGSALGSLFGNKTPTKQIEDEMAFGDQEESVTQVDFQEQFQKQLKQLDEDPPSLESLKIPNNTTELSPAPTTSGSEEELRSKIRRLEEELQELKKQNDK